ncbi:hypothetical protein, partial [Ruthenibacterium lactatiformans]|uniref:hypothetical protein n=1 Tax=Ruthenibacterium lactatiformans TaxID=1550024 RepID=UPI001A9AFB00
VPKNGGAPVCRKRLRQRRIGARKHRFWTDGFGAQRTQTAWQSTKDCQAVFAHCTSKTVGPKLRRTSEPEILVAEQGKSPQAPFVVVKAI